MKYPRSITQGTLASKTKFSPSAGKLRKPTYICDPARTRSPPRGGCNTMSVVLQKARKPLIWSDLLGCRGLPSSSRHFPSFFYILGIQYRQPTRYRFIPHDGNQKMGDRVSTPDRYGRHRTEQEAKC